MQKTTFFFAVTLSLLCFCVPTVVRCQLPPAYITLDSFIELKMKRDHIPGLVACVIKDDSIVWSQGYGFQNKAQRKPASVQSIMGIASVTKLVTATAIMQLVEQGKLSLDEPIERYLPFRIRHPAYPDATITVAQLLSHTASTSNGPSLWRSYSCEPQMLTLEDWTKAYFLTGGKFYDQDGNFTPERPGWAFQYSNAGYALLAYLVQVVSGMPFENYCTTNIFSPLQMGRTTFASSSVPASLRGTLYAYGYNMDLERDLIQPGTNCREIIKGDYFFPLCYYTSPTIGASGLYSNVEDLSHLLIAFMRGGEWKNHKLLSRQSTNRLFSPYVEPGRLPAQFLAFGLGAYAMRLNNAAPVWGHTGADPGMSSFLLFNPEMKIGAIVLANRFVDIRDLIEWVFAEAIHIHGGVVAAAAARIWSPYTQKNMHTVVFHVTPNYLPGESQLFVVGNHRYLGCWVSSGIPLEPQRDRSWEARMQFPDSTMLEFKITRGDMHRQAVTIDGKELPNSSCLVVRDTVLNFLAEDWKDQAQQ
jgi:CubicO group peptidase (beta-lactamase class C family)